MLSGYCCGQIQPQSSTVSKVKELAANGMEWSKRGSEGGYTNPHKPREREGDSEELQNPNSVMSLLIYLCHHVVVGYMAFAFKHCCLIFALLLATQIHTSIVVCSKIS